MCETRWSEKYKYKSIRLFSQNFPEVVRALEKLSTEGNYATRNSAYQLHSAITKPVFILSLQTIAIYSAVLEPVANVLQSKFVDMIAVREHIRGILDVLSNDRKEADRVTTELLAKAQVIAGELEIEITVPRFACKQKFRNNPPSQNDNEYWRRSLVIPYIESFMSSLNIRFSPENTPAFALSKLHPLNMSNSSVTDFLKSAELFTFYGLDDIAGELELWYNLWRKKNITEAKLKDMEVVDLFNKTYIFFPSMKKALKMLSTIPCTTATVERSFSTLRIVKTWLRSTMGEERLTVLCLMSVHRNYLKENCEMLEKKVVEKFEANPRRLLLN
ncbi:zinc finger MYM-type protein 1-like [Schistocerca cancellata]|uniref:zinc finger MYM-type protein 1-like n=1 Tax=Schistocerca cancellata TaxID=274614 RepID=UPI002117681B|nr:zinc finger MYM-type protein 1-like [Schistocerca cancellata]